MKEIEVDVRNHKNQGKGKVSDEVADKEDFGRGKECLDRNDNDTRSPGAQVFVLRLEDDNNGWNETHPGRDNPSSGRYELAEASLEGRIERGPDSPNQEAPNPPSAQELLEDEKGMEEFVRTNHAYYMPKKRKDPGGFVIEVGIRGRKFRALCDLGASISLLPLSIWKELDLGELRPERLRVSLADGSCTEPSGSAEDVLLKIGGFYVPHDFLVGDVKINPVAPIILGRPFLATVGAVIDVIKGRMTFNIKGEKLKFGIHKECGYN